MIKPMKNSRKWAAVGFFAGVFAVLIGLFLFLSDRKSGGKYYESINTVSQMDAQYGAPMYVFNHYPTVIGDDFISEEEMKHGIVLKVYVIRKFPSSLMSLVKHKKGENRIISKTTYVP